MIVEFEVHKEPGPEPDVFGRLRPVVVFYRERHWRTAVMVNSDTEELGAAIACNLAQSAERRVFHMEPWTPDQEWRREVEYP